MSRVKVPFLRLPLIKCFYQYSAEKLMGGITILLTNVGKLLNNSCKRKLGMLVLFCQLCDKRHNYKPRKSE